MTGVTPEANEEFVRKVKELLEAITGQPYSIAQKEQLDGSIWGVFLDKDKISRAERISLNKGAWWVGEEQDCTIFVCSWRFYNVNDIASDEYRLNERIDDDLLGRNNWEKYRKKVPGLIAELEAVERIANEMNEKYGANIKLLARQKPYCETSFDAKGMSEDEKLHEIEKHARAMYETWGNWREWAGRIGNDIYAKTSRKRLLRTEYIKMALSSLRYITGARYDDSHSGRVRMKQGTGALWAAVGDLSDEKNIAANRGVWFVKETRHIIVMMSDNLETINTRSLEEYVLIRQRGTGKIVARGAVGGYKETIISSELLRRVIEQVCEKFKVKIDMAKDEPVLVTTFNTSELRPYGKLYELEKHAKAMAEAWNRIKDMTLRQRVK